MDERLEDLMVQAPLPGPAVREQGEAERLASIEELLRQALARVTRADPARIDRRQAMTAQGLDSLAAVELRHIVEAELGAAPPLAELLGGVSLTALARRLLVQEAEPQTGLAPAGDAGEHALSYGQKALWISYRLDRESPAYNTAGAARLPGGVDPQVLGRALQALVDRHPALRTTYTEGPEGPVQRIHSSSPVAFVQVDARDWSQEALPRRVAEEAWRPFDLERGPVLRVALFDRGPGDPEGSVLVLAVHHIATDFWSLAVLVRELGALYSGAAGALLPASPAAYTDWARWQAEKLSGSGGETSWQFWRERLAGLPPLELPTDRPRPPFQSFRGATRTLQMGGEATAALQALAAAHGCTLFMVLLAAFQALLGRYSGQQDFAVGSPASGRGSQRFSGLVGYLVNLLALRAELTDGLTVVGHLARVRRTALAALAHQDFPFALLAERLKPERDPSRPPLVQAILAYEKAPAGELAPLALFALGHEGARLDLGSLVLDSLALEPPATPFDLSMLAAELPGGAGLALALRFSTDLFDAATVARLAGHLEGLLAVMAGAPGAELASLCLLSEVERHQLVLGWNDTGPAGPARRCLHGLFERQALRTPEVVAIDQDGALLTYGELEARANRLASHLRALGVAPERPVGVSLGRSACAVTALLAVLKSGGVYLPVDPAWPRHRRIQALDAAGAAVLITEPSLVAGLPAGLDLQLCMLGSGGRAAGPLDRGWPGRQAVEPSHLAYLIYTSGSTGAPKAVGVEHAAAAEHVETVRGEYALSPRDRVLQFSAASFDVSLEQIFSALAAGAALVLRGEDLWDWGELLARIARLGITVANLPTAYWQRWRHEAVDRGSGVTSELRHTSALRLVIAGGEAMSPEAARSWPRRSLALGLGGTRLLNAYGPTEAVITASLYCVSAAPGAGAGTVPVGRPMAHRSLRILDDRGQPVPAGVPGELCLGGLLARGYLGRPERTGEQFVPDPFAATWGEAGARLYRTGDLGRWMPSGEIEVLGRLDQQVKIRGFRVEPGEIEAALESHPAVGQCVVLARADESGSRRLVAYVVGEQTPDLRDFLSERLPGHMIPGVFVFLDALPLTPHGKIDRRALPAPEAPRSADGVLVAPRDAAEERLAAIWKQALRLERVGVDENFFALGGDSILALQVLSAAARQGLRLTLRQIFSHPTIAELAVLAQEKTATMAQEEELEPVSGELPLTPAQCWFFEQGLADPHHWNWSAARLMTLAPVPAVGVLDRALAALARHHDALRLRFIQGERGWRQIDAGAQGAILSTRLDLSALASEAQTKTVAGACASAQASLHLSRGPVLRALVFDLGTDRLGRLLLAVHHLVIDGVSWRILLEDLETACRQTARAEPVCLPPRTSSFGSWSRRLARYGGSAALRGEVAYWASQAREAARLPVDFPRREGANGEASARTVFRALDVDASRALRAEIHETYQTRIDDVLRTALVRAFSRWTGRRWLLVDLESHGREELFPDLDVARTVGWFTAIFPVRLDLGAVRGSGEELRAIKEQGRRIPGGGLGYGVLRYLGGDAEAAGRLREVRAEVLFNYLGWAGGPAVAQAGPAPATCLFALAPEPAGPAAAPGGRRSHLLVANCWIAEDRFEMEWSYSQDLHRRATVERLADGFLGELRELIQHCRQPGVGAYSASDFPEAKLSERDLEKLLGRLGQGR